MHRMVDNHLTNVKVNPHPLNLVPLTNPHHHKDSHNPTNHSFVSLNSHIHNTDSAKQPPPTTGN